MVEALGAKVDKLVRIAIGPIGLGELKVGELRELTKEEVEALRR
jgi:16S rRNA U516 pseudouridylate synthase RsuA-like enzyme